MKKFMLMGLLALGIGINAPIKPAAKDITASILTLVDEGEDAVNAINKSISNIKNEKDLMGKLGAIKGLLDNLDTIAKPTVLLLTALANVKLLTRLYSNMPKVVKPLQKLQEGIATAKDELENIGL